MNQFNKLLLLSIWILGCSNELISDPSELISNKIQSIEEGTPEHIEFKSKDGLLISANLYEIDINAPVIVLCHQARFNKFEYAGIAEKLNERGFNCIAIDQRSGGPIATYVNETTLRAIEEKKPVDYLDAEQDIRAAVEFASKKYKQPVILWGSSYSSTLVLHIASDNNLIFAVVSFSPGDYFIEELGSLKDKLADYSKPMFVTSSKREAPQVAEFLEGKELGHNQIHFVPEGEGHHGSRALWEKQTDGEEYWSAINDFLDEVKKMIK